MTFVLVLLDGALTVLAGGIVLGLVRAPLSLLERAAISLIAGVILGSAATFGLSLIGGLNTATALAGPLWIAVLGMLAARWAGNPFTVWDADVRASLARWRARPPVAMILVTAVSAGLMAIIYAHTVYAEGGNVLAGYETVWADWSQHLSTASSFAVGSNLPPTNPLFSGTPLLYPFLPDFHAATLMTLGLGAGPALALGSGVLALLLILLVIALARRLGLSLTAGVIAAAVCILGGGLGFVGVFADACGQSFSAAQCTSGYVFTHPGQGVQIALAILHNVPGVLAAQTRGYDGLLTAASAQPLPNMQWYTPLFAWWLPQRSMLYGFDLAVGVLVLILAALPAAQRMWTAFIVGGVLLGLMPLVHAQTVFVLVVLCGILTLRHRRREWLALIGIAFVLALPRLIQIALAPHGSEAAANAYPYFEPGWEANAADHLSLSAGNAGAALVAALGQLVSARWWGFWLINLGFAVPLCIVVLLGTAARRARGRAGAAARRLTGFLPARLLELLLGAMLVFALCNIIVFQSWDWDNTKLLVYWYLFAGLLAAAVATHWWRGRWWRRTAAVALPASMLLTGAVVMLRLLPWTPQQDQVTGPYVVASADEHELARRVEGLTPQHSVFLTFGRPNDPLLAVAGRTGVMGYYGWLWSYGTDFGTRVSDVQTIYNGCAGVPVCTVSELLHRYHVSYVEIDDRINDPGAIAPGVNLQWWGQQGYPVVARTAHITVYDVRAV